MTGSVTSTLGVRMAFEPGHGRSAVPVRSALAAATVAVGAVVAAAVFGASLITLISTPHRYGQNWTEELDLQFAGVPAALLGKVMAQPGVRGYAAGDYGQLGIGGQAVPAVGVDPLHGRDFLTLLAGHAPDGPGQLVLGERTLRAAGWHIGQVVPVTGQRDHPAAADHRGGHVPAVQPGHRRPDRPGHRRRRQRPAAVRAQPAALRRIGHLLQLRADPLPPGDQPAGGHRPAGRHGGPGRLPAGTLPAGQRPAAG